jgi:nicotinamidase-related amidase
VNDLVPNPATTALLLMDLQEGLRSRHPDADAFVAGAARLRGAARAAGMTVGHVRVALTAEEAAAVPPWSRFAGAGERLADDSPATRIDDRIAPEADELVVRKRRVGAFSTTDLHSQLDARGIDTLVLAGISTSGVVLSTVRDASDRDYRLTVVADAGWDADPEVHRVLTETVFPRAGVAVVTAAELTASLER